MTLTEQNLRMDFDAWMQNAVLWSLAGEDERKSAMFEILSNAVGTYAAVMTGGNSDAINELLTGSSQYQFEVAAEKAITARILFK